MKIFLLAIALFSLVGHLHGASLTFEEKLVEIQAPADAKVVTAEFQFVNKSSKPVSIKKHDASCSCMSVEVAGGKLTYQPGEAGTVRANFDMGNFSGAVDKTVLLWVDDDPEDKPSVLLTTRVEIPVLVALEPKTLQWELGTEPRAQVIRIKMNHDKPINITGVSCSSEAFSHELKTVAQGAEYELHVTPKEMDVPGLAILRIETDCDIKRHQIQQAFAVVRRPVAVPATPPAP
jgi:hypothetical protein